MQDRGWQRNLAALWVSQMLAIVSFSFVFPFLPLYLKDLGVQGTAEITRWAGLIVTAMAVSMAVAQPIWGSVADRLGRKPMVVRSMIGSALTLGLMGFATSPEQLLVLRFLHGAISGTVSACTALAATTTPKHRLGFALGLMQVAVFLGNSIGPLVGGLISDTLGYRAAFYFASGLMLVGGLTATLLINEKHVKPEAGAAAPSIWASSRSLMAIGAFPFLVGVIFMIHVGNLIVNPVLSLFVAELNASDNAATAAGLVVGGSSIISAAAAVLVGRFGDRVGHRVILSACLLGSAISYFPQAAVQEVWQLLLLQMLLGFFLGGMMPSANALVTDVVPHERRGAAFGLMGTASALSNMTGPLTGASVAAHWGLRSVFLVTGGLFVFAFAVVSFGLGRAARLGRPESALENAGAASHESNSASQ